MAATSLPVSSAATEPRSLCVPRDVLIRGLLDSYNERTVAYGIAGDGTLLEIFASPDGSSFTVVKTGVQGYACIVDTGVGWWMGRWSPGRDTSMVR